MKMFKYALHHPSSDADAAAVAAVVATGAVVVVPTVTAASDSVWKKSEKGEACCNAAT